MKKNKKPFKEDFIQFVWKFQLFDSNELKTDLGEPVTILKQGSLNTFSGPDFTNGQVKIGNELWAGNIEIHYAEKEWYEHNHHLDEAYNNVILHVLFLPSQKEVKTKNGIVIPTISLRDRIRKPTIKRYKSLMNRAIQFVPCATLIKKELIESIFPQYFNRLAIERLERKVQDLEQEIENENGSLQDVILIQLFKYFGGVQNKNAFAVLARSLPDGPSLIKNMTSVIQLEALLFGLADLLHGQDEYAKKLENEFMYLKNKYKLQNILRLSDWKFSGVHPGGFPTIRIAQLADFLFKQKDLFSLIMETPTKDFHKNFVSATSDYWKNHVVFGREHKPTERKLTKEFIERIAINVFVPFLFFYGKMQLDQDLVEKSIDILSSCKMESNGIVKKWAQLGVKGTSALDSQALLQLKTNYCVKSRCLDCNMGYAIMKQKND